MEKDHHIELFNMDLFSQLNERLGLDRSKKYENWSNEEKSKVDKDHMSKFGYCLFEDCKRKI